MEGFNKLMLHALFTLCSAYVSLPTESLLRHVPFKRQSSPSISTLQNKGSVEVLISAKVLH